MPWFWNGTWDVGPWLAFPILMCLGMLLMMAVMMGGHRMGGHHVRGRHDAWMDTDDPALDTLRQRFASGELTQEEYEERKKVLLSS